VFSCITSWALDHLYYISGTGCGTLAATLAKIGFYGVSICSFYDGNVRAKQKAKITMCAGSAFKAAIYFKWHPRGFNATGTLSKCFYSLFWRHTLGIVMSYSMGEA
jgi:hypothetical protein